MSLFKKFLVVLFSALFLLSLGSTVFADPDGGDDPIPPPPIMPGEE